MKRMLLILLVAVLLVVPVSASAPYIQDDSGLLGEHEAVFLEEYFVEVETAYGFTPIVVTVDSFRGLTAREFAGGFYDAHSYGTDGMLLLVSLEEGEWYILTNGACADRIPDYTVQDLGENVVSLIREQRYYDAFHLFAEESALLMEASQEQEELYVPETPVYEEEQSVGGNVAICMLVGMVIGAIAVGVMAFQMKSVRQKHNAADYVRTGSFALTGSRDIYLYSTLHRTPRPKSNSSGGSRGGGSRGGAGGRI